ncbi:linear amide C-N hydrolase [Aquiflexum sp. LQ15W]|uniref:linear amide C-N hydrolase n=1 Tax=Cognataquiflexum nitidum TaxID=2922272 RepID=UPI001F12E5CE|nr:linear amide C-N hydrolase [Cognataquiflexum nitidum]MCH6200652.1 linear amide C-N hydrolase [Cognataquiflexum nitidum]
MYKYRILILVLWGVLSSPSFGSSAFFSRDQTMLLAKNFDWKAGHGYIFKNKKKQKKYAYGFYGTNQAQWVSLYGSVTFNQFGKEFPVGGINEAGLVVEQLYKAFSIYPNNGQPSISESEWIQFQLDNYATASEVLIHLHELTIHPIETVQFFIADQSGNAFVIEFTEGKPIIHPIEGTDQVITNAAYHECQKYYESHKNKVDKNSRGDLDRYVQIKSQLSEVSVNKAEEAFDVLRKSSENQDHYKTYWTIAYNLSEMSIAFYSSSHKNIKEICLNDLNFETDSEIEVSPINSPTFQFKPLTENINGHLIQQSLKMIPLSLDIDLLAEHLMDPSKQHIDQVYQSKHFNLVLRFKTNKPSGVVSYIFRNEKEQAKAKTIGLRPGQFIVNKKETVQVIYGMPKGEFDLACFQDPDFNGKLDNRLAVNPNSYGFLRTQKGSSGPPPLYVDTRIILNENTDITIKIK